jgi:hypothetical protein
VPFPEGVLAGAITPRQIAEKARQFPRESASLFARGMVAKWYENNGWTYPVQEPAASGVAAVQQFFEALGLTKPPKVGINVAELQQHGRAGDSVLATIQIVGQEKRPVYAHASSDQPWLKVEEVALDGWVATVRLRSIVPDRYEGEALQARLTITANGRQRFVVPVSLTVTGPAPSRSRTAVVVDAVPVVEEETAPSSRSVRARMEVSEAPPVRPVRRRPRWQPDDEEPSGRRRRRRSGSTLVAALPVVFLFIGLSVTMGRDLVLWLKTNNVPPPEPYPGIEQVLSIQYHDTEEDVKLAAGGGGVKPTQGMGGFINTIDGKWEASMRFGLTMKQVDTTTGRMKRLTYEPRGQTNNTVVRLDGREWIFGERPFRRSDTGQPQGNWPGRWKDLNAKLERPLRDGRRSIWVYDNEKVLVTQTVGLVPGEQSGKLDTCLIHYRLENRDSRAHAVGLRFLLDTFIGGNDGVPFLVPGEQQLCSTFKVFDRAEVVPDFIQALESENLQSPGIIARIQLKVPGLEAPSRVTLGSWPNPALGGLCKQEKTLWDVPVWPIKRLNPADSAVTIYWEARPLEAGAVREMGFAYGLGNVASGEAGGRLALTTGGSLTPGGEITLTAYVNNPVPNQALTLKLPEGFALIAGDEVASVPPLPLDGTSRNSPVTWRIRAGQKSGKFSLQVKSSTGVTQSLPIEIKVRGIFGG